MTGNVHTMWSEDDLDQALAALNAEVPPGDEALANARAELLAAAGAPETLPRKAKKPWGRWVAAVAAVAAVITVMQVAPFGDKPVVPAAAADLLIDAADKIGASDPVVGPGQYLYVEEHNWRGGSAGHPDNPSENFSYQDESFTEVWIPADRTQEWLRRTRTTGQRKWIVGNPETARAEQPKNVVSEQRARCGGFGFPEHHEEPCARPSHWSDPTAEYIASLPTDPRQLYDRLYGDAAAGDYPPGMPSDFLAGQVLQRVSILVKPGVAPAGIRANLYRALAITPGLVISEKDAVNVDGRRGVALGLQSEGVKWELIVDPGTGQIIGDRQTRAVASGIGEPAGTVTSSAVKIGVAAKMGDKPGR